MSTKEAFIRNMIESEKNSDAAYGARMRYRLQDMLDNPYSFLPSYKERYQTLAGYAESLTPHQAYAMTMLLGRDSTRLYPDMPVTAELQFPAVNKVDTIAQCGWYYFAGTCFGEDGVEYGILCMLFNASLLPQPLAQKFDLTDVENQIIDVQLAVSVAGGKFYQVEPTVTAGTSDNVKVSDKLFLSADNCAVGSTGDTLFPITLQASGTDLGQAEPTDISIDLRFSSASNYLPPGLDGAMPLVAGIGTRYYSIPGIVLDAPASSLTIGKQSIPLKSGKFWFDHQWGTGLTPGGIPRYPSTRASANLKPQTPAGWDFFVMNFDVGSSMTLNFIHTIDSLNYIHQTGPVPPANVPPVTVVGKYMDPFGTLFNVSGLLTITDWRKTDHSPNPDKYKSTPTWVPHCWQFVLEEKVVPESLRKLRVEPISDDAQALFFSQGSQYVEAATRLMDANYERCGVGYSEAVGYVDNTESILLLAGLPATEEMQKLFTETPPSLLMKFLSFLYMLQPSAQTELKDLVACGSFAPAPRPVGCGTPK